MPGKIKWPQLNENECFDHAISERVSLLQLQLDVQLDRAYCLFANLLEVSP